MQIPNMALSFSTQCVPNTKQGPSITRAFKEDVQKKINLVYENNSS